MTDVQKIILCVIAGLALAGSAKYFLADTELEKERAFLFTEK